MPGYQKSEFVPFVADLYELGTTLAERTMFAEAFHHSPGGRLSRPERRGNTLSESVLLDPLEPSRLSG